MAPTEKFPIATFEDHKRVIDKMALRNAENYVATHTDAQILARLQAVPDFDKALGLDAHGEALENLENSVKKYSEFVELFLLRDRMRDYEESPEVGKETEETEQTVVEPIESRVSTPETEASTVVGPSSDGEGAEAEVVKQETEDSKDSTKEKPKDKKAGSIDLDEEAPDFADRTNSRGTIPRKDSEERASLWSQMKINTVVMSEMKDGAKNGRLFESRTNISSIPFEVRVKEASVRPVLAIRIATSKDVDNAQALIESDVSGQYLTHPAMPVMVTLKFPKPSRLRELKDREEASVNVELGPATVAQIMRTAFLLFRLQAEHWEDGEKSWTWKAMSVPKKQLKGSDKDVMMLMRSNPVFVRDSPHS